MKRNPVLFLDTSVILAAIFSSQGGSAGIIDLSREKPLKIVITEMVVLEAHRKINKKYVGKELNTLVKLLSEVQTSIKSTPSKSEVERFDDYISDRADRHILAGAKKYKADYLITLDKKHFFTEKLSNMPNKFEIKTPRQFLTEFRN